MELTARRRIEAIPTYGGVGGLLSDGGSYPDENFLFS